MRRKKPKTLTYNARTLAVRSHTSRRAMRGALACAERWGLERAARTHALEKRVLASWCREAGIIEAARAADEEDLTDEAPVLSAFDARMLTRRQRAGRLREKGWRTAEEIARRWPDLAGLYSNFSKHLEKLRRQAVVRGVKSTALRPPAALYALDERFHEWREDVLRKRRAYEEARRSEDWMLAEEAVRAWPGLQAYHGPRDQVAKAHREGGVERTAYMGRRGYFYHVGPPEAPAAAWDKWLRGRQKMDYEGPESDQEGGVSYQRLKNRIIGDSCGLEAVNYKRQDLNPCVLTPLPDGRQHLATSQMVCLPVGQASTPACLLRPVLEYRSRLAVAVLRGPNRHCT